MILAELPVPHPEEVVRIHVARTPFDQNWTVSFPAYQRLRIATPDVPLRQLFGKMQTRSGNGWAIGPAPSDHRFLIVGEVADARVNGAQREPPPVVYMSINQDPAPVNSIRVRAWAIRAS